jgi:large subunit ribosomal protein L34e
MVQRLTYRRRLAYNTASNGRKIVKTPGGKLVYQRVKKAASVPICGDTKKPLRGVRAVRPREASKLSRRQKTVSFSEMEFLKLYFFILTRIIKSFLIFEN